ncbi:MAG: type II secretion system protein [Nitrosomonadales bacterium]|nr:type II secretion system protein [Nitrosomonadales bacterium]
MIKLTNTNVRGFSLLEMAIVLTIVGLLLAGLLPTLSSQIEQQRRAETNKQLNEIRDALYGYAIINGYLPCPTTTTDLANANYGNADATCSTNPAAEGYLPWKTLGVAETDAWGIKRGSAGASWVGYWRYRVDRNFADPANKITLGTGFSADALSIRDTAGNSITSTSERPIAIVYSTGPNLVVDGQNASFEATSGIYQSDVPGPTFDDILIWIARPQLFNRMVTAGKLP